VFIGGGSYARGEIEHIDKKLLEWAQPKSMAVVPFATAPQRRKEHFDVISTNYRKFGSRQFTLLEDNLNTSVSDELLNGSDAISFTGGRPERLIDTTGLIVNAKRNWRLCRWVGPFLLSRKRYDRWAWRAHTCQSNLSI
jgi:hypothetical protein